MHCSDSKTADRWAYQLSDPDHVCLQSSVIKVIKQTRRRKSLLVVVSVLLVLWAWVRVTEWWRDYGSEEKLPLFRDLYSQEEWPGIEHDHSMTPEKVPRTVHYLWCGSKQFRFQHYLGLLSAIRLLQPLKIVFHYTHLPVVDTRWYNVWFQELKQSFANLELQPLHTTERCGSRQLLDTALGFLSTAGGIYLGENVIMTRFPRNATHEPLWFAFADTLSEEVPATQGVVFVAQGFGPTEQPEYARAILSGGNKCGSVQDYDRLRAGTAAGLPATSPCVVLTHNLFPRDVWSADSPFAEFARWLYYGRRKVLGVRQTNGTAIPRTGHLTWLDGDGAWRGSTFTFLHFLSVLSALHVAGLSHVYVHGHLPPRGPWWERLRGENVTFVPLDPPRSVFQQTVASLSHRSDVMRVQILQKYGGVYQDRDVVWAGRLPDELLRYPAVLCPDWPRNGEWPESFNTGVFMAQRRAAFLRHFLSTLRHFLDHSHAFNAVMMPYRAYERHPDSLYVDRHLQVICFRGICHPAWHDDYIRDIDDVSPPRTFDWREARAYHFTVPKPPSSLASPAAIARGTDLFSELGRHVLKMAGKEALLSDQG